MMEYKFKAKVYPFREKKGALIYIPRKISLQLPAKKEVICILRVEK